jgi:hypothetical protein
MKNTTRIAKGTFLIGLIGLILGCVLAPNEGPMTANTIGTFTKMRGMTAVSGTSTAADRFSLSADHFPVGDGDSRMNAEGVGL